MVLRRGTLNVVARNEARQEHEIRLTIRQGKSYREVNHRIGAGVEISIAIPEQGAQIEAWDLSEHVRLPVESAR